MAKDTQIEWTHFPRTDGTLMPGHTINLWWGCTEVHEGCDNCYARVFANRYKSQWGDSTLWGNDQPRKEIKSVWDNLDKYQKAAAAAGERHAVFVGSMMDIFEKLMPIIDSKGNQGTFDTDYIRTLLFEAISDYRYQNLLFLFLTKRPSNINKYIPEEWKEDPPSNVMFGASAVSQRTLLDVLRHLDAVNGMKFISMEPQLEFINLPVYTDVDWIIQGGESGGHKRPFDLQWARDMRDQCKQKGIPYFFKQIDKIQPIPEDLLIRQFPGT